MLDGQFLSCVHGFPVLFLVCWPQAVLCSGGTVLIFVLDVAKDACTVLSKRNGTWEACQ